LAVSIHDILAVLDFVGTEPHVVVVTPTPLPPMGCAIKAGRVWSEKLGFS
jgi:hypothetical protein